MIDDVMKDGINAERLLTDDTFRKAMQQVENDAAEQWKAATTKEKREELHALVRAVDSLRTKLEAMKGNKRMEEARDKLFEKRTQQKK